MAQASRLEMLNGEAVEMAGCLDTALVFTFYDYEHVLRTDRAAGHAYSGERLGERHDALY